MSRRTRAIIFIVATVIMLVAMIWWVFGFETRREATSEGSAPPTVSASDESATVETSVSDDVPSIPGVALDSRPPPPIDAPVADTLAALLPSARAGDARAACRVAMERITCRTLAEQRSSMLLLLRAYEARADAVSGEGSPDRFAALQIALLERARQCAALPAPLADDGVDWLARAAAAGHVESALRYMQVQGLGWVEGFEPSPERRWSLLGHPHFAAWQRDAPVMARRLLDAGEPAAAFMLSLAYAQDDSPFGGLLRDDPVEAAAMRLLLSELAGRPPSADALKGLTLAQQAAARQRVAALRGHFTGRTLDRDILGRVVQPAVLVMLGGADPGAPPPCSP